MIDTEFTKAKLAEKGTAEITNKTTTAEKTYPLKTITCFFKVIFSIKSEIMTRKNKPASSHNELRESPPLAKAGKEKKYSSIIFFIIV